MWEVTLDLYNPKKSIVDLEQFFLDYDLAIQDAIEEIRVKVTRKLYENATLYGIPDSAIGVVKTSNVDGGFVLTINSELGVFYEYGTGIKGSQSPHPFVPTGWIYDVNGHGEKGWWYPTTVSDPNPYKWTDNSGTLRGWTKGKPSSPFVYDTYLYARRIFTKTINKHVKRVTT